MVLTPPKLQSDWKTAQREAVKKALKKASLTLSPDLVDVSATRTAIDEKTGAASMDDSGGKLFLVNSKLPKTSGNNKDKDAGRDVQWSFRIHGPELAEVLALIQRAQANRPTFGKLKTLGTFTHIGNAPQTAWQGEGEGDLTIALVLRSAAIMHDYATASTGDVLAGYAAYFETVFGPNIRPKTVFAEQDVRGGYQALRFSSSTRYKPWLLTKAGSVFVFHVPQEARTAFTERVNAILKSGLPVAAQASLGTKEPAALNWENCPFLPENGFGEIMVDPLGRSFKSGSGNIIEFESAPC